MNKYLDGHVLEYTLGIDDGVTEIEIRNLIYPDLNHLMASL